MPGVSGMSLYVPRFRVPLQDWCDWTGQPWPKVKKVVGQAFRMCRPDEGPYTMAANAVLRLILQYDVDPAQVRFLGLGTESATDNAAGAVIVRGMVDQALVALGKPPIARACEVPEFKHACLGGMYALKAGARALVADPRPGCAIVVSSDVAEYARGSSGEPTQGAGAVAFLLKHEPTLFSIDLAGTGSSSAYRGLDFRKPMSRHFHGAYCPDTQRLHDFPLFNGRYSTFCYLDAVVHAAADLADRAGASPRQALDAFDAILMHRPYAHITGQALATLVTWARVLEGTADDWCQQAGIDQTEVKAELEAGPDLRQLADQAGLEADPFPKLAQVSKAMRSSPWFIDFAQQRLGTGDAITCELGNLYTAALPAWLGSFFTQSLEEGQELAGKRLLALGYGSGDAAEAMPLTVCAGWQQATEKMAFHQALLGPRDLNQAEYEALHDRGTAPALERQHTFVVERTGGSVDEGFQDVGVEYYSYLR